MHDWLYGDAAKVVFAGAMGGGVAALAKQGRWREKVRVFAVGTMSSYFLSPLVEPLLEFAFGRTLAIDPGRIAGMSGFVAGATGLLMVEIVMRAISRRLGADDAPPSQNASPPADTGEIA